MHVTAVGYKDKPALGFLLGGASSSEEESSLDDSAAAAGFPGTGLTGTYRNKHLLI